MIIVIIVIGILILFLGAAKDEEGIMELGTGVIGLALVVLIGMIIGFPFNIDKKIELYETENQIIETKIKETVRSYMEYEQETYKQLLENADLTTVILKYPELNSNELVKSEIETYKENNNKLKALKEEQINKSTLAWWLYFGH